MSSVAIQTEMSWLRLEIWEEVQDEDTDCEFGFVYAQCQRL